MKLTPLFILCIAMFTFSCAQNNKEQQEMKTYEYKTDKKTVYGMDLSVPGPYELYINDIAARKDYTTGMHNTFIEINPYVLKSGTYDFTLKLLPEPSEAEKGGIQPSTAEFLKVAVSSYEKTGDKTQAKSFKEIQSYPVAKIKEPVPFVEVKGKFTVDLPYELEGWSNGQDLSKMDKKELEKKVVAFYEKARTILNNGDAETWMKMEEKRGNDIYIFNFSDQKTINEVEEDLIESIKEKAKGRMLPVENFSLELYANSKIVTLERTELQKKQINNEEILLRGKSALLRKAKVSGLTYYPILLYLPQNSNEFVIIRK